MAKLSDLLGLRTITVEVMGLPIEVTYRLSERTPATTSIDPFESVVVTMVRLVESWDLVGDDDKSVPITEDALSGVPVPVLRRVLTEVLGDNGLGEASRASSGG